MTDARQPLIVLTTLETIDDARELIRALVAERIVACGTALPGATSIYRWEGAVTTASEVLVVLKTVRGRRDALVRAVDRHHPYALPELLAVSADAGLPRYLEWLAAETAEAAA